MKKEVLSELLEQCRTLKEISEKAGLGQSTIKYWLSKHRLMEEYKAKRLSNSSRTAAIKLCPSCNTPKISGEFHKRPDGRLHSWCKECQNKKRKPQKRTRKTPLLSKEEKSRIISEARKKYLAANPDKHPWRRPDKLKSTPCEKMKEFLREKGVVFAEEFQPNIAGRFFSIDIALPEKKIAIEINGSQHYEPDGKLKPYYQERHDLLEADGWKVYEIYYSICYNLKEWENMIPTILESDKKIEFDYSGSTGYWAKLNQKK